MSLPQIVNGIIKLILKLERPERKISKSTSKTRCGTLKRPRKVRGE